MKKRGKWKRMACMLLAATLVLGMCVTVYGAVARATTMRLAATTGSRVTLKTINGSSRRITKGMRLYNGNVIETGTGSYAYISLDSSKAVKLDANAKVQVRQEGKKLRLLVSRGRLFFNVNVPLKSDESLDVQTSTMVTGVRGTCGIIEAVSDDTASVYLLEGALEISWKNPETGKSEPVALKSGEKLTLSKNAAQAPAAQKLAPEDVPAFAAEEVAKDTALQQKITEMGGPDVSKIIETVSPSQPSQPGGSGQPSQPGQPGGSGQPSQPEKPSQPEEPEQPGEPGQPEKPNQPDNPDQPENPEKPDQPGEPTQPEKPNQPDNPDQPENPEKPDQPEEPKMPEWDFTSGDIVLLDLDQLIPAGKDVSEEIRQAWNEKGIVYVKGGSTGMTNTISLDTLSINENKTLVLDGVTVKGQAWTISGSLYIDTNASLQLTGSINVNAKGKVYTFSDLKADKKEGDGQILTGGYGKFEETSKQTP